MTSTGLGGKLSVSVSVSVSVASPPSSDRGAQKGDNPPRAGRAGRSTPANYESDKPRAHANLVSEKCCLVLYFLQDSYAYRLFLIVARVCLGLPLQNRGSCPTSHF